MTAGASSVQPAQTLLTAPSIAPNEEESELLSLPFELFQQHMDWSLKDFSSLIFTCRKFHEWFQNDETSWTRLFLSRFNFPKPSELTFQQAFRRAFTARSNLAHGVYASSGVGEITHYHRRDFPVLIATGKWVISGGELNRTRVWDVKEMKKVQVPFKDERYNAIAAADQRLYLGQNDESIGVFDLQTGEMLKPIPAHSCPVAAIYVTDQKLISGGEDGKIKVWDLTSGEYLKELTGHEFSIKRLMVAGETLISFDSESWMMTWNLNTYDLLVHSPYPIATAFASAGDMLIVGEESGIITFIEAKTGTILAPKIVAHPKKVKYLEVFDGVLISAIEDEIAFWDLETQKLLYRMISPVRTSLAFSAETLTLFFGTWDHKLRAINFLPENEAIFEEIAKLLRDEDPLKVQEGKDRFNRMPKSAQAAVDDITSRFQRYRQAVRWDSVTSEDLDMAQAITDYLTAIRGKQ